MKKRRKQDYAPHITSDKPPRCAVEGCDCDGLYKAPKDKNSINNYRFFCLEHIREHNAKWDFFSGMEGHEIEAFMRDAVTGHRPTWERGARISSPEEKLYAALNDFLNINRKKTKEIHANLSAKTRKALAIFEIEYPYSTNTLKNRYKKLVKLYHPDRNPGDKLAEEKFKAVAGAYKILLTELQEVNIQN